MFSKSSIVQVVSLCGACIALYIGSGFAIMQEVMQYEASYGSLFWAVVLVTAVIYAYTNLSFAANGAREKISRGGDIYAVYCGGKVGTFFDFSAFFCCMSFVIMLGGANSTAMQQWGLPNGVGGRSSSRCSPSLPFLAVLEGSSRRSAAWGQSSLCSCSSQRAHLRLRPPWALNPVWRPLTPGRCL